MTSSQSTDQKQRFYAASENPSDGELFSNAKRHENAAICIDEAISHTTDEVREYVTFVVSRKGGYDLLDINFSEIEEWNVKGVSVEGLQIYDKIRQENLNRLIQKVREAANTFNRAVVWGYNQTELKRREAEKKPLEQRDEEPMAKSSAGQPSYSAVAKTTPARGVEERWLSWADEMAASDEEEKKLIDRISKMFESTRKRGEKASDDVVIPGNLRLTFPMLYEAMQTAAKLTRSVIVEDQNILIVTRVGALMKSEDASTADADVKESFALVSQLSRSLIQMFSAREYENGSPKLGMHFAIKQFMVAYGNHGAEKVGKHVIDALFGSDEALDELVTERLKILFTDSKSAVRTVSALAVLLRRLAKKAIESGLNSKLAGELNLLAEIAARKPKGVAQNLFVRQTMKTKKDGVEITKQVICPPKVADDSFFSPAEKTAVAKINSIIAETYSNVESFDVSEEDPFNKYYERVRCKLVDAYDRTKAASEIFSERRKQVRDLAFNKQKEKLSKAAGKKNVSNKDVKIEREIYQDALDEIKAKKTPEVHEMEALRALKSSLLLPDVRPLYKDLPSLNNVKKEHLLGMST